MALYICWPAYIIRIFSVNYGKDVCFCFAGRLHYVWHQSLLSTNYDLLTQVAIESIEEVIESLFKSIVVFVADDAPTRSSLRLLYSLFHLMPMLPPFNSFHPPSLDSV
jgi:hypothetical protein